MKLFGRAETGRPVWFEPVMIALPALLLFPRAGFAHQQAFSTATVRFENGGYEIELVTDLDGRLAGGAATMVERDAWLARIPPPARMAWLAEFSAMLLPRVRSKS